MADRRDRFDLARCSRSRRGHEPALMTLAAADRLRADGGEARRRAARGAAMAVRAEMGRLPLPRVQGRRGCRAAVEGRAAVQPLLSRDRRGDAGAAGAALRARRRARRSARRHAVVRRAADAHPSGGEPRAEARARTSGASTSCSTCSSTPMERRSSSAARRTARRARGIRAEGVRRRDRRFGCRRRRTRAPTWTAGSNRSAPSSTASIAKRRRSALPDRRARRGCRSSSRCARRIASSAAFATARSTTSSGRCCWASSTTMDCFITSASRRTSRGTIARHSPRSWKN